MIRYTTPTVELTVDAVIPEANVLVTFSQGAAVVTKSATDITRGENNTSINVLLTQEETSMRFMMTIISSGTDGSFRKQRR